MPFYMEKFRAKNGIMVPKLLENIEELAYDFDIVINCTGLGAKRLMSDELMHPIRGHIFRVSA